MTSPEERTSAEAESSRLPHRGVTDGVLHPTSTGKNKYPISNLEQIRRVGRVFVILDRLAKHKPRIVRHARYHVRRKGVYLDAG